jgi:hypothetical protein
VTEQEHKELEDRVAEENRRSEQGLEMKGGNG